MGIHSLLGMQSSIPASIDAPYPPETVTVTIMGTPPNKTAQSLSRNWALCRLWHTPSLLKMKNHFFIFIQSKIVLVKNNRPQSLGMKVRAMADD